MKKNLKRTLSVFMAALMLMSAWVFVAPEQNKVGAVNAGKYTWRVLVNSWNNTGGWNSESFEVRGSKKNGKDTDESLKSKTNWYVDFKGWRYNTWGIASGDGQSYSCAGFTTDQFPTTIKYSFGISQAWGDRNLEFEVYLQVWNNQTGKWVNIPTTGKQNSGSNITAQGDNFSRVTSNDSNGYDNTGYNNGTKIHYKIPSAWSGNASGSVTLTVDSGAMPKANKVVIDTQPDNIAMSGTDGGSTTLKAHLVDQYGVTVASDNYSSTSASFALDTNQQGNANNMSASITSTATNSDTWTITAADAHKQTAVDSHKMKATLSYSFNGATATETTDAFTVTDPQRKFKYDGNGGTLYYGDAEQGYTKITDSNNTKSKYYYNAIGEENIPTKAEREGFELIGYYKSNAKNSNAWTKPVAGAAGTNYQYEYLTKDTIVEDGPENSDTTTWYAAWWRKNCTVRFVDEKGADIIPPKTVKYGVGLRDALNNGVITDLEWDDLETHQPIPDPSIGSVGAYDLVFKTYKVDKAYDANGADITDTVKYEDYQTYQIKGDTVFKIDYQPSGALRQYNVTFRAGDFSQSGGYLYGAQLSAPATPIKAPDNNATYTFKGWIKLTDPTDTRTMITLEEGEAAPGAYINDFTVREDATYVAVYETVRNEYTVKYQYIVDGPDGSYNYVEAFENLHWGDNVPVPDLAANGKDSYNDSGYNFPFECWTVNRVAQTPITKLDDYQSVLGATKRTVTYVAKYGIGSPAIYTIKFEDKDGEVISQEQYAHGLQVTTPADPETYRDENNTNEYNFSHWEDQFGRSFSPIAKGNLTYKPVYNEDPLYSVSYYNDGTLLGVDYFTAGSLVPTPTFSEIKKEPDMLASAYTFTGWKTGDSWLEEPGDHIVNVMPAENVILQAKYEPTYITYEVVFRNDDPTVEGGKVDISRASYRYGEPIVKPADPTRPKDNTYTYIFRGWDKTVSSVCTGDVVYNATYKKVYNYYNVVWINNNGEKVKSEFYTWNEVINPPAVDVATPTYTGSDSSEYHWAHKGWKRVSSYTTTVDENGRTVIDTWNKSSDGAELKSGDRVDGVIVFKPTFELEATTYPVSVYDEAGTTLLYTFYAKYGEDITKAIGVATKDYDNNKHYEFKGWKNLDGTTANLTISGALSVKPSFEYTTHTYPADKRVIDIDSTYFKTGLATDYCSCGHSKEVEVALKTDEVDPQGILYVKDSIWDSLTNGSGSESDVLRVSDFNKVVITANDDESGVLTVSEFVTKDYVAPASIPANAWDETTFGIYENGNPVIGEDGGVQLVEARPNLNCYIFDIKKTYSLEQGDTFFIYYKVVDRMGRETIIHSSKLYLDNEAPEVTFVGDNRYNSRFCLDATFKVTSALNDEVVVMIGDEVLTPNADGVYTYGKANVGLHQIVVTDLAGNVTRVNFEIIGNHNPTQYTTYPSCTQDGYVVSRCKVCQNETGTRTVIPALGHDFSNIVIVAATCTEDGSETHYCVRCGLSEVVAPEDLPEELKANGDHNYGEWKVIEYPTCSSKGLRLHTCLVCGETQDEEIPIDENAHRYGRATVIKPTCTEGGYTIRTCRYDSLHTLIESEVEATGHIEGDWTVKKQPTCTEDGLRVKYCTAPCCEGLEVPILDDNNEQKSEVLPKLGHTFYNTQQTQTVDGQIYAIYKCARCHETELRDPQHELEEYTITFLKEDGTVYTTKTLQEGQSITAADIDELTKAATNEYKYQFDCWVLQGTTTRKDYPIIADSNMTLTPTFSKRYINYTISLNTEKDGEIPSALYRKIGYKHYNEVVTIDNGPIKPADEMYEYTFAGWITDTDSTPKTQITVTGDVTLYAAYTAKTRAYKVTFADENRTPYMGTLTVVAGSDVVYNYETGVITYKTFENGVQVEKTTTLAAPTKAYDKSNHYAFEKWDNELKSITSDQLARPVFKATAHTYDESTKFVVKAKVNCNETEISEFTCVCGNKITRTTQYETSHVWSASDGSGVLRCTVGNCTATRNEIITYTVTFMNEDGSAPIKTLPVVEDANISERIPTPEKNSTVEYNYEFTGWSTSVGGDIVEVKTIVKENAVYYANFKAVPRTYTVVFAYDAKNPIKIIKNVPAYGSVTYDGDTPIKNGFDDYGHWVFSNWNGDLNNIVADTYILANFKQVKHDCHAVGSVPATCTHGAGVEYKCACGYTYVESGAKPLGHDYKLDKASYVEPDFEKDGYEKQVCTRCGDVIEKVLPAKEYFFITIELRDVDDNPVAGARVSLYDKDKFIAGGTTAKDGIVILRVPEKKMYTIVIDRDDFKQSVKGALYVNDDGSVTLEIPDLLVHVCNCTCHRTGFWPSIFRFFHKIIKLLTGDFGCCGDPDPMYTK